MGITWKTAKDMLNFAMEGKRPVRSRPPQKRTTDATKKAERKERKTTLIGPDVVRLKDEECMSWPKIIEWLKDNRGITVSEGTVVRAWDAMHRESLEKLGDDGGFIPKAHRYSHLGESKYRQIREGLNAGKALTQVACEVGCGVSTVYRESRRLWDK